MIKKNLEMVILCIVCYENQWKKLFLLSFMILFLKVQINNKFLTEYRNNCVISKTIKYSYKILYNKI